MFGLTSKAGKHDPWPLKFRHHNFGVRCYNTQHCRVLYNDFNFTLPYEFEPSGAPERPDWKEDWRAGHIIGEAFASPVQAWWISLDGTEHRAEIDLAKLFGDRLVRHNVSREDIPEGWLAAWGIDPLGVDILMEVYDRTISVFMRAHITTKEPQIPGNSRSCHRRDLVQVWTHIY